MLYGLEHIFIYCGYVVMVGAGAKYICYKVKGCVWEKLAETTTR